jgi:hypothetical protein
MKNLLATGLLILIAGLIFAFAACGSGASMVKPSPTETKPNPAVKLAFTTLPPGSTVAGSEFNSPLIVAVEDAQGSLATGYKGLITLTITAGTGNSEAKLFGGTKTLPINGTAEFKSISIDKVGVGYTLTATSGNLLSATSAPFTVLPGAPAKLAFSVQPPEGQAGTPLTPYPEVTVQDLNGNTVTGYEGSVTLQAIVSYEDLSDPNQYQPNIVRVPTALSGTTTVRVINGLARFTDIAGQLARPNYTLIASSDSLSSATSASFTILPGAPAKLEFTVQPSGGVMGKIFETQPKVAIEDAYGNVARSSRASITVSITPGTGSTGAVLSGANTLIADDVFGGVAEFADLSIDLAGSGYTLTATSGGMPSVKSQAFNVSAP